MLGRRRGYPRHSGNSPRVSSKGCAGGRQSFLLSLGSNPASDLLPRNGDWSAQRDARYMQSRRLRGLASPDHGDRRRISQRGRGGGDLVPVALRAAAGAALSLLHGRRVGRGFPRRRRGARRKAGARSALLSASLAFVLGFTTVFVALGAGASTIGRLLRVWQEPLAMAAGVLIILMGLNFLGVIRIPLLSREARFQAQGKPASAVAAYVMGLAFAFGWTPCIGPVLGPILTLAGGRETVGEGALLLAAYSLGLGIPFLIAALFLRRLHALPVEIPRPSRPRRKGDRRAAGRGRRLLPHRRRADRRPTGCWRRFRRWGNSARRVSIFR